VARPGALAGWPAGGLTELIREVPDTPFIFVFAPTAPPERLPELILLRWLASLWSCLLQFQVNVGPVAALANWDEAAL